MTLGRGKFASAIADAEKVLVRAGVLDVRNPLPNYPAGMPAVLRKLRYREAWEQCMQEGWYDLRLLDQSIFQFKMEQEYLSFGYLECPHVVLAFEDFAFDRVGQGWEVIEGELRDEYEFYLNADLAERSVTPVRYDFEPKLYRSGVHPAGHLHFGISNEIRVSVAKVMNPMSFSLFVLRQFFPSKWEMLISEADAQTICREVRSNLEDVPDEYLNDLDHLELQLR